jgi:hypothetical protein
MEYDYSWRDLEQAIDREVAIEEKKKDEEYERVLAHNNILRYALKRVVKTKGRLDERVKVEGAGVPLREAALLLCIKHRKNNKFRESDLEIFKQLISLKNHPGSLTLEEGSDALGIFFENEINHMTQMKGICWMLQYGCVEPDTTELEGVSSRPLLDAVKRCMKITIPGRWLEHVVKMFVMCGASPETKIANPDLKNLKTTPYENIDEILNLQNCSVMDILKISDREKLIKDIQEAQQKRQDLIKQGWDGKLPVPEQFVNEVFGTEYQRYNEKVFEFYL